MILFLALTLEEYIKEVEKHSALRSRYEDYSSYSGAVLRGYFPPNPILTFNAMFMPGAISLNQPLPLSWPIDAASLREMEKSAYYSYESFRNEFLFMAIDAYLDVIFLKEKLKILEEILSNLRDAEVSIYANYKTGKAGESDLRRIKARIDVIESEIDMVSAELNGKLAMVEFFYGGKPDTLTMPQIDTLPPLDELLKDVDESPRIVALKHMKKSSSLSKVSSLFSLVPTVSPGVLYNNGNLSFSLSFILPIWFPKYIGDVKRSSSISKSAELEYRSERLRLSSLLVSEYERYLSSLSRERVLSSALKELENAYASEIAKYKTMRSGTTDYLFVQNDVLDVRIKLLKERINTIKHYYRIKSLLGEI